MISMNPTTNQAPVPLLFLANFSVRAVKPLASEKTTPGWERRCFPFRHGGTPSHHPFRTMGFSTLNDPAIGGTPFQETNRWGFYEIWPEDLGVRLTGASDREWGLLEWWLSVIIEIIPPFPSWRLIELLFRVWAFFGLIVFEGGEFHKLNGGKWGLLLWPFNHEYDTEPWDLGVVFEQNHL